MKAEFLDFATVSNGDLDTRRLDAALPGLQYRDVTAPADLPARLRDVEVVLVNKIALDCKALAAASRLRLICLAATGTNAVDLREATTRGIAVTNIRGYCTGAVVQHVFAMILSLTQHLRAYQGLLEGAAWRGSPQLRLLDFPIRELAGKTLGIVGYGELGGAVARMGEAFGMRVLVAARPGGVLAHDRVPFASVLQQADVLSLHCPLTPSTRNLIGAAALAAMKPDALLINTARGALVDAHALAEALRGNRLGGAGIDVLHQEPPVDGDPLLAGDIPNLILTPHVAWASVEARQRALDEMARNVSAFLRGERRNRVDE